jgi:hypothetical protein
MSDEADSSGNEDGLAGGFDDLLHGFSLDSHRARRKRRRVDDTAPPHDPPRHLDAPHRLAPTPLDVPDVEYGADDRPAAVRAYAWTRGRTTSSYRLEIESMVSTSDKYRPNDPSIQPEYHSVAALCRQPRSVAEVAALLSLPLGVMKVLLGDMLELSLLTNHPTASTNGEAPEMLLMERILAGLHRL